MASEDERQKLVVPLEDVTGHGVGRRVSGTPLDVRFVVQGEVVHGMAEDGSSLANGQFRGLGTWRVIGFESDLEWASWGFGSER